MGYGDWIFLGVLLAVVLVGALLGFGKVFSVFVVNKYVRIAVAVFICYTYGGMILSIPFVSQLLIDLRSNWSHIAFLSALHLEIIIYYIVLFVLSVLLILIFSKIVKGVSETDVLPVKILNKVGGAILFGVLAFTLMFLAFQIIVWIGGNTAINFQNILAENAGKIVLPLYTHNPLLRLVELVI